MKNMQHDEQGFSFKNLFVPFTSLKAIHWIIIIGLVVFANMLFNGFVYDDIKYIQQDTEIHTLHFDTFLGKGLYNAAVQYRPIPALYFTFLYMAFNNWTFFYHIIQLFLHISSAILVLFLFKKFFNITLSFVLSLLFLIHPIQVESVSYISASAISELFFLFGMISVLLSFKNEISRIRAVIIFCLLFLSIITKETGLLFLFIIIFYRVFFTKKARVLFLLGGFFTALAYFFVRVGISGILVNTFEIIPINKLSLVQRLFNIPAIFFYYLTTFFFPARLAISQNWVIKSISISEFYLPLCIDVLFLTSLGLIAVYFYRKSKENLKGYLFFLFWFVIGMLLHVQIIPLDMTVADRWFYFPIVGLLGCIGFFITIFPFTKKAYTLSGIIVISVILLLLSLRTIVRNTNWTDQRTLLTHDISVTDDYTLEDLLGINYLESKQYNLAIQHMTKSIELNPDPTNINNLGAIYQLSGNYTKAKEEYYLALHSKENSNKIYSYINLANFLVYHDDPKLAIPILKDNLLQSYPNIPRYYLLLAIAEYKVHNQDEAFYTIQKARMMFPADTDIANIYTAITSNVPASEIRDVNQTFNE